MQEWMIEVLLLAGVLGCLIYVSRSVVKQRGRMQCDAPMDVVRLLISVSPESPFKLTGIRRVEWVDDAHSTVRVVYENGRIEGLIRANTNMADEKFCTEGAFLQVPDQHVLGTFRSETTFKEIPGGVLVESDVCHSRGDFWRGFALRLGIIFSFAVFRRGMEPQLKAYCAKHYPQHSGAIKAVGGLHDLTSRLGGWPFLLSVAAVLWFVYSVGLWPGLVLIVVILIHEGGHLYSMRRHGLTASAVLIPFFGGLAYSAQPMPSDASDAEMTLMGPTFGLALAFVFLAIAQIATESDFWLAAAGFTVLINGFNLLPIPPLDGGRYAQLLMRRLGAETVRWISLVLVACGAALTFWLSSIILMVLFVALGIMLVFSRCQDWDRPIMTAHQLLLSAAGFLALLAGHFWVLWHIHDEDVLNSMFRLLEAGPLG